MIVIKPKVNIVPLIISVIFCAVLFLFPKESFLGAKIGVETCISVLIPSLFPFMALSTFIIRTDALFLPGKVLNKVTKLIFKLPEGATPIIIMALIGGYPVGLKMISDSLKSNKITENEAKRLSMFCMNAGPAFTITTLGVGVYKNTLIGFIIFISLCISNICLGFLTRFLSNEKEPKNSNLCISKFTSSDITASILDGFEGSLRLSAWVILFGAFTLCLTENLGSTGNIISSFLEISSGALTIAKLCPIEVVTALLGFGGFCVHCQVLGYLKDTNLKYKYFLAGRLVNSALSSVICHFILYFLPLDQGVSYTFSEARVNIISVSIPTIIAFIFMCITFTFNIDRKEKMC